MKNDLLYNQLRSVFGNVLVASKDSSIVIEGGVCTSVSTKLNKKPYAIRSYGEQYRVNCPFCVTMPPYTPDTGHHLWISYVYNTDIVYNGEVINFGWAPAKCYRRDCLSKLSNKKELFTLIQQAGKNQTITISDEDTVDKNEIPEIPFPPYIALTDSAVPAYVHEYLEKRGVTAAELQKDWGAVLGFTDFYKNPALVFPIYQRNAYVSWQARYIGDNIETFKDGTPKPKYYIPKNSKKSWMLYNMDRAKYHSPGVLVEGIFDCIKVGEAGVAMFGKKPSEYQCRILSSLFGNSTLVWIPDENDPDSVLTATQTAEQLMRSKLMRDVRVVRLPYGDPGTFKRSELWEIIKSGL